MLDPLTRAVYMMMAKWGGDATMTIAGDGTYDPSTSTATPSVKQYKVRVIAEDYIQKASGITSEVGGLIQTGDKRLFIKPEPGMPRPRSGIDSVTFQGIKWNIHTIKEYNPSGCSTYLYEVYART